MPEPLCIPTLDPSVQGGVRSMMQFVYDSARDSGFDPFLAYNIVPGIRGQRELTTLGRLRARQKAVIVEETFDSMKGVGLQRRFPEAEFLNYRGNSGLWREVLKRADLHLAVCGSGHCALPLAYAGLPFAMWVATPFVEDRIDRIRHQEPLRKLRDRASIPLLLRQERFIYQKASRVLALSRYTRDALVRRYPFLERTCEIASFPIDLRLFAQASLAQRSPYMLFTGRFDDERKNIPLLLRAFRELKDLFPALRLRLIGSSRPAKLDQALAASGLSDRVDLVSHVPRTELVSHYQNAALFVVPSYQEGLCISALEAMSCGTPVISTRCGGPEEVIQDGINGFLVPNDDTAGMRDAIARYLTLSPERKQMMGDAARAYVEVNHDRTIIWPRFLDAIRRTRDGRSHPAAG